MYSSVKRSIPLQRNKWTLYLTASLCREATCVMLLISLASCVLYKRNILDTTLKPEHPLSQSCPQTVLYPEIFLIGFCSENECILGSLLVLCGCILERLLLQDIEKYQRNNRAQNNQHL